MNEKIYIVGAGGFSSEVTEYIKSNNLLLKHKVEIEGYFDINNYEYKKHKFDAPYLGHEKNYRLKDSSRIIIAISNSMMRKNVYDFLKANSCVFPSLIHNSCLVSKKAKIAEGAILCPYVTITSNANIGINFHANIYSYVAHDCVIGDNVTFAPGVKCNGNVEINDNVYVGAGAIIFQGKNDKPLRIGQNAIISAGAVVTKDVPDKATVFGNPARLLNL